MDMPTNPDVVEFDALECCALERACAQEAYLPFVHEYLAGTGEAHPVYKAMILLGIFKHTFYLAFIPHEVHRVVYAHVAAEEKAALEQCKDTMLECGHLASLHCEALGNAWAKIKLTQEYN